MNNSTKSILTITPSALGIIALSSLSITFSLQILAGLVVLNLITDMIIRLSTNDKDLLENFSSALLITLITSVLVFVPYLFAPIFLQVFPFIKLLMLTNHLLPSLLVSSAFILDIILRSTFSNKIDGSASNGQTYTYNGINPLFKGNPDGKQQLETLNKENADRTGLIVKNLQRIRDMITNNGDENNISTSEVYTEVGLDSIDYQVNAITERLGQYINDITTTLAQKEQYHNAEIQELTGQYEAALARKEQELKTQHEETLGDLKKTHSTELSELKTQHETILAQKEQELTSQHEAALNSAKQSHTTEIEELKTQHTANIQELTSQHEEALNSAKQSHTTEIEELKTQHTANIQELKDQHAAKIQGITTTLAQKEQELTSQHEETLGDLKKTHSTELSELKTQHETILAQKEQELTSQHEAALNSAKQSHTTEIEELKTQHTANIQELTSQHEEALNSAKQSHTTEIEELKTQHTANIQELKDQHAAKIQGITTTLAQKEQELTSQHEETLGDLKKTHSTELSELKTQHETILAQKEQELTSQHEAALNSAKQSHTTEIEELKTQHTANIQELTSQHEEALNSAKQSHTTEIEELKTQHTANIQELTSQHEEALNSAKQSHTTEIEELKTQHTANIQELKEIHVSKLQQNEVKISDIEAQLGVKDEKIQHLESAALKADNTKLSIISTVKQNNADLSNELSTEKDRNESLRGQIIANLEEYADKTRELKQTIEDLQNQISKLQESNEDQAAELDSYHENIMNIQGLQEEKDNALTSLEKHVAKLNEQLGKIGIDILKEDLDQFKALIDGNVTKIAEFKAAARTLVDNHFINISEIHQANNPGPADSSKDGLESDDEDINLNGEIETSFQSEDSDIREKGGSGNAKALVNHGLLTAKSQEGSHTATSNPQEYQNTFK
jgi:hypothetical protein